MPAHTGAVELLGLLFELTFLGPSHLSGAHRQLCMHSSYTCRLLAVACKVSVSSVLVVSWVTTLFFS